MRYGFEIESESMALLVEAVPLLARVSGDRIRTEISLILEEDKAADMLGRLDELGVLRVLHPDLRWDKASAARLTAARGAERDAVWEMDAAIDGMTAQAALSYLTWLLAQRSTVAASVAGRLRLPAWLSKAIIAAARAYPELGSIKRMKPSAATQWLDTLPLLAVFGLWLASKDKGIQASLFNYAAHWRHVRPKADGALLGEMGIPAGPRYGQLLGQLRAAWLDGEITDAAGEGALLERLVEKAHE
jgi:tRNA nucleotidyltransferase (CCA-adding enzyme)